MWAGMRLCGSGVPRMAICSIPSVTTSIRTCALWQAGHSRQQPEAQVWQAGKDRLVQLLRGHTDTVLGVAFCPKGHWLATSSGDTTIKLWQ